MEDGGLTNHTLRPLPTPGRASRVLRGIGGSISDETVEIQG